MSRIASGTPRPTEGEGDTPPPRGMRGGFRGGMSNLRLTKDGRTLFYQEGESVYCDAGFRRRRWWSRWACGRG